MAGSQLEESEFFTTHHELIFTVFTEKWQEVEKETKKGEIRPPNFVLSGDFRLQNAHPRFDELYGNSKEDNHLLERHDKKREVEVQPNCRHGLSIHSHGK